MKGWIIDAFASHERNTVVLWVKGESGKVKKFECDYSPSLYIHSSSSNLKDLENQFRKDPLIRSIGYEKKKLWLGEKRKKVLGITLKDYLKIKELAKRIDEAGNFSKYEFFNVDLSIPLEFMIERGIFPMSFMEIGDRLGLLEDVNSIDYRIPELKSARLDAKINSSNKIPTYEDPLSKIYFGKLTIEKGDEKEMLNQLINESRNLDPDIIYTQGGDSFLLPYLYHRAEVNGIGNFYLGREKNFLPAKKGRSYFSYGRVIYKPPEWMLNGRTHLDMANSFLLGESGIYGLIELSRLSRIPLQLLSRVTPGTAITAIQIAQALKDDVLIGWKKSLPEDFKDAKTLLLADRGGMIYDPRVGIYENVVEIDFTSLYPSIMVKHNVSPETVLCKCCKNSKRRAPTINYNLCEKRIGLIPRVLKPIIDRRIEYKRRIKDRSYSDFQEIYKARKDALKWLLVTCFGYTGYRNARFGRIECHEVINAYGRELLLETAKIAEEVGYEVLHGIVDSLWLKSNGSNDHERLCNQIYEEIGIPLEFEGVYKWIVFLPNKRSNAGALNRYFGIFENGKMKVRGLEVRRSDTPSLIKDAQKDMLKSLAKADNIEDFYNLIPEVIEVIRQYADKIMRGECDLEDLVFTSAISKDLKHYFQLNNNAACLLQLRDSGLETKPGEKVRYIITNANSKNYYRKVRAWQLSNGKEKYDREKYLSHLLGAGESILLPFGYTKRRLANLIKPAIQLTL
jgi:DNA polymerase elongation subunit (family B)